MAAPTTIDYVGTELDLFADATTWKAYWSQFVRPHLGSRILDVGAGIGATARIFANVPCQQYVALEPDPQLAARIQAEAAVTGSFCPRLEVLAGTIDSLPADLRFDTILYIDVLEHIEDDRLELEKAATRLPPGGRIVVLAPAHPWLFSPFDAAVGHFRRYTRRSLLGIQPAGTGCRDIRYLDSTGLLASLANRLLLKASVPSQTQILAWDRWMVPMSRFTDVITLNRLGKTVLCVFEKSNPEDHSK